MIDQRFGKIEVLSQAPTGNARATPLLFVHGAYTAAWCWAENFLPWFAEQGWQAHAISLSGHGGSAGRQHLDSLSIADYVRDVAEVVSRLPARPVLIGHSMGGFVVQKFLEREDLPAAVLMASVPPQGLLGSAVGMGFAKPGLMRDFGSIVSGGSVALETLREVLFAQPVSDERLKHFMRCMQPESHRAVWDMSMFDLPSISRMHRPPMLILGAEHDQLISASTVEMTGRAYGIKAEIFPAMGHGMMLDADWRKVAQRIVGWLEQLPGLA
ncbi:MAG: alpha/beta fold hydrolase [Sterolibacteriaceae bacterium]|uniref:Alpha/beta fold hydrolase n=1 Tax=Candidatus Methylophosphatis roskildensis TaxID=2899263 RepID=A0A9D7HT60_9PROT|nr:alpha/beta fold hydrolase [Candidatus Methylophosphatis roskildensis]MBK7235153.1 alpha/beta fold hydrolase [Sterolibacteriaceae bacterium]